MELSLYYCHEDSEKCFIHAKRFDMLEFGWSFLYINLLGKLVWSFFFSFWYNLDCGVKLILVSLAEFERSLVFSAFLTYIYRYIYTKYIYLIEKERQLQRFYIYWSFSQMAIATRAGLNQSQKRTTSSQSPTRVSGDQALE